MGGPVSPPPRMTIWGTVDPIRKHWLTLIVIEDFIYGVVNMFGKAQQPYQILLRSIAPLPLWYALFVVTAVLITYGYSVSGGMFGTFGWGAVAIAAIITIGNGTTLSYGASVSLLGWVAIHSAITYDVASGLDDAREQSQRRP